MSHGESLPNTFLHNKGQQGSFISSQTNKKALDSLQESLFKNVGSTVLIYIKETSVAFLLIEHFFFTSEFFNFLKSVCQKLNVTCPQGTFCFVPFHITTPFPNSEKPSSHYHTHKHLSLEYTVFSE